MQHNHWPKYVSFICYIELFCTKCQKKAFSLWLLSKLLKMTVSWTCGGKFDICVIPVPFDNITHVTCIFIAYDRFNRHDVIRYSYISFCAKSASISLFDFSVDIFRQNFIVGLDVNVCWVSVVSTLNKYDITILVGISHENRFTTPYVYRVGMIDLFISKLVKQNEILFI